MRKEILIIIGLIFLIFFVVLVQAADVQVKSNIAKISMDDTTTYFDFNKAVLSEIDPGAYDALKTAFLENNFKYKEGMGFYTSAKTLPHSGDALYIEKEGGYINLEEVSKEVWASYASARRPSQRIDLVTLLNLYKEIEIERSNNHIKLKTPITIGAFTFKLGERYYPDWYLFIEKGSMECWNGCSIGRIINKDNYFQRDKINLFFGTIDFSSEIPKTEFLGQTTYGLPITKSKILINAVAESQKEPNFLNISNKDVLLEFYSTTSPLVLIYERSASIDESGETVSITLPDNDKPLYFAVTNLKTKKQKGYKIDFDIQLNIRVNFSNKIITITGPSFSIDNKLYTSSNKIKIDLNKKLELETSMQIGTATIDTGLTYNKETDTHDVNIRKFREGVISSEGKGVACALISGGDTAIKSVTGTQNLLGQAFNMLGLSPDSTKEQITNILKNKGVQRIIDKGLEICDNAVLDNIKNLDAPLIYTYIKEPIKAFYIRDIVKEEVEKVIKEKEIAGINHDEKEYIIDLLTEEAAIVLGEEIEKNQDKAKKFVTDFYIAFRKNDKQGMTEAQNNLGSLINDKARVIKERVIKKVEGDPRITRLASKVATLFNNLWPFGRFPFIGR